jgi:hypothetical protein
MGWFIISAVAGLITYMGGRLVYRQISKVPETSWWTKIIEKLIRYWPGLVLGSGLALIGFLSISVWWAPNFPYAATILNRLVVVAEGETTQVALGIIFGLLAGFTIQNAGELIFPSPGTAGPDGEIPIGGKGGAKVDQARHLWLGGSLMLLIFLGIFAPHIGGLVANLTRFKTALFEFEARTNVASQRVHFRESRENLATETLKRAAGISLIINRDVAYLEKVALKLVEAEIGEKSKLGTDSVDFLDFHMSDLEEQKKQLLKRIKKSSRARVAIEMLLVPVLKCGEVAVSEFADLEIVRNSLRPPFNDLKLIMAVPSSGTVPESLARRFVDSLRTARKELVNIVEDRSACPKYSDYVRLHDEVAIMLEDRPYVALGFSLTNIFLENFAVAKDRLRKLNVVDVGNFNGNISLTNLLFSEGALAREYIPFLKDMMDRAKSEAEESQRILQRCEQDASCKASDEHEER